MKRELKIYNFETNTSFKQGHQIILSIQNIELFRQYTTEIYNACEKRNVETEIKLWEELTQIYFYKTADFITNLWNHNFINTKLKRQLYAKIEEDSYDFKTEIVNEIEIIYSDLVNLLEELWDDQIITYDYQTEFSLKDFLKQIDLKPEINNEQSILDNLYTYTDFVSEIRLYEMFIFVNLSQVLTEDEFEQYSKYTLGKGLDCLFLESNIITTPSSKTIVIDEDYYDYMI